MDRKIFAIMEGEQLPDGSILDVGSLYIDTTHGDRIPVCWASDNPSPHPEGWAHGFERREHDDHGDLSMIVVMNDPGTQDMLEHFWIYPYATDVEEEVIQEYPKRLRRVTKARVRMLQLVPIPGMRLGAHHHDV